MILKLILFLTYFIFGYIKISDAILFNEAKIEITNGILQGYENMDYYGFQGIPYAQSPIGENRFASPKPYIEIWNGIYNASRNEIICAQLNPGEYFQNYTVMGSEDCLYLNVYVPKTDNNNLLPVMVYLHSGAFTYGSSTYLKERTLMRSKTFILVTLNYRLGPFGFLSTEDNIITGNMGLKDQRLALKWIKENIKSFNGNSENIILTGFSSGAVSVDLQTMSPGIENLISKAVAFSGSALNPWALKIKPLILAKNLAKTLKCKQFRNGEQIHKCLLKTNMNDILNGFQHLIYQRKNGIQSFGPVIESKNVTDAIITEHPRIILEKQCLPNIPYLSSFTAEDGAIVNLDLFRLQSNGKPALEQFKNTPAKYLHWILYNDGLIPTGASRKNTREILKKYNLTIPIKEKHFQNLNKLFTDVLFKNGIIESLKLRQNISNIPIYSYIYDNPPLLNVANLISKRMDLNFGTVHGDDIFLFLNSPLRNLIAFRNDELEISKKFILMLNEFVVNGKPKFGEMDFPESNSESIKVLRIKANSVVTEDL